MPTYVSPFTGTVVTPTDVSYFSLSFSTDTTLAWPASVNPPEVPAARILDCVASTSGLTITLPPANEGTQGADILFRNLGSQTFEVVDADGGQSITIAAGVSKYVYLADNTTAAGEWQNVTFGTGTSSADAVTLAGAGLTTISGQLATTQNISNVSTTPSINDGSRATTFNWIGGVGVLDLPVPSSLSNGWYVCFRNNGTGTLTIQPPSPALINGQENIETNPGDSGFIMYDLSSGGYITVGWQSASNISFTAGTYDVDAVPTNTLDLVAFAPIIQTYIAQSGTRSATLNVVLPPITQVYLVSNQTNESGYNITFQNEGSLQPPLVLNTGRSFILLSDGYSLFNLTQTSAASQYVANGSAAAPAYSFANDPATGMYLVGANILGLSANGVQIGRFDNSNLLQPIVNFSARLNANSISGGVF
jgi:hypothetical protein